MFIDHVAIWVKDLEKMRNFYQKYFHCTSNNKYTDKDFESYFLEFDDNTRIELMKSSQIPENLNSYSKQYLGIIHIAIKLPNKKDVGDLIKKLKDEGYKIISEPRETGDGYYESCILDPENNIIEIVG